MRGGHKNKCVTAVPYRTMHAPAAHRAARTPACACLQGADRGVAGVRAMCRLQRGRGYSQTMPCMQTAQAACPSWHGMAWRACRVVTWRGRRCTHAVLTRCMHACRLAVAYFSLVDTLRPNYILLEQVMVRARARTCEPAATVPVCLHAAREQSRAERGIPLAFLSQPHASGPRDLTFTLTSTLRAERSVLISLNPLPAAAAYAVYPSCACDRTASCCWLTPRCHGRAVGAPCYQCYASRPEPEWPVWLVLVCRTC